MLQNNNDDNETTQKIQDLWKTFEDILIKTAFNQLHCH